MPREARFNQRDYTHYVIVSKSGVPLIETGWSYAEDAREHIRENLPKGVIAKVFAKAGAKRAGLDPDDNSNWFTMPSGGGLEGHIGGLSKARTETLLRKLVTQDTQGIFRDSGWAPVHAIFERLREAGFEIQNAHTEYYRNRGSDQLNDGKRWTFEVPFTKGRWYVQINAANAGSTADPSGAYDVVSSLSYSARGGGDGVRGIGDDEEVKPIMLSYGVMPPKAEFVERTEGHYPYPMELAGEDQDVILDLGINLNKNGIEEFQPEYAHKLGLRVLNAEAMYRLLTKLKDKSESGSDSSEATEAAGQLASAILGTLGYEWV